MMAMVERQGSQGFSIHSERIPAVVAVDRAQANAIAIANANAQLEPVDLDVAAEHEERVRQSLELLRKKVTEFMASAPRDPKEYTEEQKDALNTFAEAMTQIKQHQEKLKQDMIYARKERRRLQAEHKQKAMVISQPKQAPPIRMEELRALNMVQLDENDLRARYELAQKPKPIVPSGGFTGFRVAPDLKRMDFSHADPNHPDKLEAWRPDVQNKTGE